MNLDQKINLKAQLARIGAPAHILVRLNPAIAAFLYWRGFGVPVTTHDTPKKWRK